MFSDYIILVIAALMLSRISYSNIFLPIKTGTQFGRTKNYSFSHDRTAFCLLLTFYIALMVIAAVVFFVVLRKLIGGF